MKEGQNIKYDMPKTAEGFLRKEFSTLPSKNKVADENTETLQLDRKICACHQQNCFLHFSSSKKFVK